ncbi:MAG: ThuA domain-containing protein [Pseudomonadota bacterium]|nr:ThuA domain-containing protein [Pseudomonadota bacterium]MEC7614209.1 ThuA domain-containing protein [Pseudomonadota bacterium]MEC8020298.1 ThuA domain-containing protein [Pseudomonadota bacterium]MEC8497467.1 ThuA domain-containing protein [Pseudomonadota bacterium]|tara:strand:+ start:2216 stop:2992 length:777 start_codon:yes stop_codon:yes gene_type:complete
MTDDIKKKIDVVFIVSGKWHDIDFARLEILKLLAEDERIRTRVFEDYSNLHAIENADFLITYTCDVLPTLEQQKVLRKYVESGNRWFALHGTNSILNFEPDGKVDSPRVAPIMMDTLGSQFIAHPPIEPYKVEVSQPDHPLVEGFEEFETTDELYLMDLHGDLDIYLEANYGGKAEGFVEDEWPQKSWPVFYSKKVEKGEVLYLTLGHARGHYDMHDLPEPLEYYPAVERCAWDFPQFYTLLRRGINWAKERSLQVSN